MRGSLFVRRSLSAVVVFTALLAAEGGRHTVVAQDHEDRPAVLVNPRAGGGGTARTIQEGIDMADSGGKVLVACTD